MPVTVSHALSATTPDNTSYEVRPSHWNSNHLATINAAGSEISGAFSNANGISFGLSGTAVTASYTVPTSYVNALNGSSGAISLNAGSSLSASTNGSSVTFGLATNITTALQSAGAYLTTAALSNHSHGNPTLALTNISGTTASNSAGLTLSLSVGAGGAGDGVNILAAGTRTATISGTVLMSNANGISWGLDQANGSILTASHNGLTTARASTDAIGLNTAGTNVTWTANSSGLSINASGYAGTATAITGGAVMTHNSAGFSFNGSGLAGTATAVTGAASITLNSAGLSFNGAGLAGTASGFTGANISGTMTNNTAGFSLSLSGYASSSLSGTGALSISVNGSTISLGVGTVTASAASNTTQGSSGTLNLNGLVFNGAGGVSVGVSNGSVVISGGAGAAPAASAANGSFSFNTMSFSNLNGVSFGTSAGSAITASHNGITTGRASNDGIGLNTAQTNVTWTVNSSGLSFNASGYGGTTTAITGAASITKNSAGFQFNGAGLAGTSSGFTGANISATITHNTAGLALSMSVAAPGAAAEANAINLLGANTAGNTTGTGSTIGWSGVNLTLSGTNNSQIVVSAPATSSLVGASGLTVSSAGSTISVGQILGSYFDNYDGMWPNSTTLTVAQSTSGFIPFLLPEPISHAYIRMPMTASLIGASTTAATTGNSQFSYGLSKSHNFVLYSRGSGGSSQSLMSVASTQVTEQQSINVSANANSTQFSYTNRATYPMSTGPVAYTFDYSSSAASLNFHTSNMTAITGLKMMEFGWANSLTPGQYWLAYGMSSSSTSQYTAPGTQLFNRFTNFALSQPNLQFGTIGDATQNSVGPFYGLGSFSTAGGGTTANLPISAITTSGSHNLMMFQLGRIA